MKKLLKQGSLIFLLSALFLTSVHGMFVAHSAESQAQQYEEVNVQEEEDPLSTIDQTEEEIVIVYGEDTIETSTGRLVRQELPSVKYPNKDFNSFKSWMPYTALGRNNQCGRIAYNTLAWTDDYGLRRFTTDPSTEFTVNQWHDEEGNLHSDDDYLVAMGNFYKLKGEVGQRFVIVTEAGNYTVRVSDEKSNAHTDQYNMGQLKSGNRICILEFLVHQSSLHKSMKSSGSIATGPVEVLGSPIIYIYRIYED